MFKNYFSYLFPKKDEQAIKRALSPLQNIHMDDVAKARTRALLQEYMAMQPLRQKEHTETRTTISHILLVIRQVHLVPVMSVVLVFGLTAGTAFAAEGTLPGDLLYPIKVHVTEEVRAVLTTNPKAQAGWQIERTARRLEEASTLAVEGKFTDKNWADIQTNLAGHVARAERNAKLLTSSEDYEGAETVGAELHAVLKAHGDILVSVLPKSKTGGEETNTEQLVSDVIAHLDSVAQMSAHTEASATQGTNVSAIAAISEKQIAAQSEIAFLRNYIEGRKDTAAPELIARANETLKDAEGFYATGVTKLETGATTSARKYFTRARDTALDTKVALAVQTRLLTKTLKLAEGEGGVQPPTKSVQSEETPRSAKTASTRTVPMATTTKDTERKENPSRRDTLHSMIGVLLYGSTVTGGDGAESMTASDTVRTPINKDSEEKNQSKDTPSEDQEDMEEIHLGL